MKSYIIIPLLFVLCSFGLKDEKQKKFYYFKTQKTEGKITTARFILVEDVDLQSFKNSKLNGLISFSELNTEENYYQVVYNTEFSLNDFRAKLLEQNSDFDKKFIIITDKSFYNK